MNRVSNTNRQRFLTEFPKSLLNDAGSIFVGAGVSMAAGYPSWTTLLREIGEELGVSSTDVHDLAALAQWSIQSEGGHTKIRKVIRDNIKPDRDIPVSLKIISRLPIRHIWTTNYDRLIERAFEQINRPLDTVSGVADLAIPVRPGATRLYKMHGSVDRLDDLVISTDDYELFRSRRGAFLPLLLAQMTGMSMLFVGLSFTDPNVRHVLSLIRESFTTAPPEHFAIVRPPHRDDFRTAAQFKARSAQHALWAKDLSRYGLIAVEVKEFSEVPDLLVQLERRVAKGRVWVSGSWPVGVSDSSATMAYEVASALGKLVGRSGLSLVSGAGLVVGSASIAGFLEALRDGGGWDLDRRLVARPFPQPLEGRDPDSASWTGLRRELARLAGFVVFVGGAKYSGDTLETATGVLEEAELAEAAGAFLIPIGATGGAALELHRKLLGSRLPSVGATAARPLDSELTALCNTRASATELVAIVEKIMGRVSKSLG